MKYLVNSNSRRIGLRRPTVALVAAVATLGLSMVSHAQGEKQLTQEELQTLLKYLDAKEVVEKVEESGITFSVDEAVLKRLQKAGASDSVLNAVQKVGKKSKPNKAVAYQDVLNLLKAGVPEARILGVLQSSPTEFVLDAEQEQQLRKLGASDQLIAALKGNRPQSSKKKKANTISDLAVILDCSGSMDEKTTDGVAKMKVAQEKVSKLIRQLPEGLHVSFLIYGHDKQRGCQSVKVVRPLSPLTSSGKSELVDFIGTLEPAGKTPIALSLRTAYEQLADRDAECGLILISDGKETCNGDPQAEAAKLAKNLNCTFGVNVVGFDVDTKGRQQLQKVAEAGGGAYYNAENAAAFSERVMPDLSRKMDEATEEPAVSYTESALTSIQLKPLTLKGLPKVVRVGVYKHGGGGPDYSTFDYAVQSTEQLSSPMVVGAGKYDIWYKVETKENKATLLKKGLELPKGQMAELNFNKLFAAIVVPDPKIPGFTLQRVGVYKHGGGGPDYSTFDYAVQRVRQFGKPLMVPAGRKYDIYLKPKGGKSVAIKKGVTPEAGEITVVGQGGDNQ